MKKSHRMLRLFELWRGNLPAKEARELEDQIGGSEKLKAELDESRRLFDALQSLAAEKSALDQAFSRDAMLSIKQSIPVVGGYMKFGSTVVWGFVLSLACVGAAWFYGDRSLGGDVLRTAHYFVTGVVAALLALTSALAAFILVFMRRFRLSAAVASIAVAIFACRSLPFPAFDPTVYTDANMPRLAAPSQQSAGKRDPGRTEPHQGGGRAIKYNDMRVAESSNELLRSVEQFLVGPKGIQAPSLEKKADNFAIATDGAAPATVNDIVARRHLDYPDFGYHAEDREGYGKYAENPRNDPAVTPLSTFSIDVDTGSYTNTRRFLSRGQLPPKDSVRIEEYINYFDYTYESFPSEPFTVTFEAAPSPIDKEYQLLRVGLKARTVAEDNELGWNLVFLIDVSGSMNTPNKLPLVKESLKLLARSMRPIDRVALVTYAGSAGIVLDSTLGSDRAKIESAIDLLTAGGGTNGSGGIELAYQVAQRNMIKGSVNRVVLATDGDFNVGVSSFDGLMTLIEEKRRTGVTLTTLGFGEGNIQEQNMEQLANRGNGNYFYIDSFREARKVLETGLAANMQIVAKDVKLQMEFNPAVVKQYRLIGFDNRKLNREDFTNDAKDAGEIGAGHTVTALYEIVLADSPMAQKLNQELRYKAAAPTLQAVDAKELGFLKVRYKEPEGDVSKPLSFPIEKSIVRSAEQSSADFKFAAAVAYFGEILRESQFLGSYTLDDVLAVAQANRGVDSSGTRAEFIKLVEDARSLRNPPAASAVFTKGAEAPAPSGEPRQ